MNREQLKHLAVSATVTFPATFPRLAEIRLREDRDGALTCGEQRTTYLVAIERPSLRVTMRRVLPISDVRAIFIPRDSRCVHPDDGTWLLGPEVEVGIRLQIANRERLHGIVYVAEQTSTLLEVEAGMTAADSAQYYPPLPCDRAVNHYDPYRQTYAPTPEMPEQHFASRPVCEPYVCEPYVCEPAACEPSVCEPAQESPRPEVAAQALGESSFAPTAVFREPFDSQRPVYQTLRRQGTFEPAPFPSVEARR